MSGEGVIELHPSGPVPEAAPDALPAIAPPAEGLARLAVLEALLFAAIEPLNAAKLGELMGGLDEATIRATIDELRARLAASGAGIMIAEVAGGWQFATRVELAEWVLRLHGHRRRNAITPALLETLSIVAYKQPVTRGEIESIRGVDSSAVIRALSDAGLIEAVGRREVAGRPSLYGTTDTFLKTFGLKALEELPRS